ncbi:nuclear transport factor 2 family protein [Kamptonema formosum]|uniref:nuclear transport factor 2 family protein n=1 Tax=Kamptonema formosum TaxID=331992 RepID=UPI000346020E|nr:nuclear transport factor 2 family protein [Oscillatoria sp. PCC 10802]
MAEKELSTIEVARRAFGHFTHALKTGESEAFLDMLTDDFTFWFPVGKYHGLNAGKERFREFLQYVYEAFPGGISVTLVERVTSNETTAVFEFRDEGTLLGEPYKNRIAVSFDIRGGKICGYREYFGSDGKSY